jgi:hypothetical protein
MNLCTLLHPASQRKKPRHLPGLSRVLHQCPPLPLTLHRWSGLVQHFQHVPRVLLSPCGVQNGPYGRNRAAVFPDHLPDIFLRDPQFNDERVLSRNPVHAHVVRVVHNRFRDMFDQFDDGRGVTSHG